MRRLPAAIAIAMTVATLGATLALAQMPTCEELWMERNQYYKAAGFCFRTTRGVEYFGNDGCRYYSERDLRFPGSIRARIAEIMWLERRNRCF
jgi:hypothetical protein